MPWSGPVPPPASGTSFSHRDERARPGYYRVSLGSPGVRVELTAGARSALARIAYPRGPVGVLGLKSTARPDGSTPGAFRAVGRRRLEGSVVGGEHCGQRSRYRLYFAAL